MAAPLRFVQKITAVARCTNKVLLGLPAATTLKVPDQRGYKRWMKPYFSELYKRRMREGPQPQKARSEWINWNYDAEIYAFGKRLGEEFNDETLRQAFIQESYVASEQARREELGVTAPLQLLHNGDLVTRGREVSERYCRGHLRAALPRLPEEGVRAVSGYLMSDDVLLHVASNLGIRDLIISAEALPDDDAMRDTLLALVGALANDQGPERAGLLVQDLLVTQLIGRDVRDLWQLTDPMGVLVQMLAAQGAEAPEPRLLRQAGQNTLMACYTVGLYSGTQLVGEAHGETVGIAEQLAAQDALNRVFRTLDSQTTLPLGNKGRTLNVKLNSQNPSVEDYCHARAIAS